MQTAHVLFGGWVALGAIVGSFLNAFIHRWPRRISMVTRTRSFCPQCEATIAWYDNIPILSWLALLGRCRSCRKRIPVRYLVVEILSAGLFAAAFWRGVMSPREGLEDDVSRWTFVAATSFASAVLIAIAFIDLETFTMPSGATTALVVMGLALAPLVPAMQLAPTIWTGMPRLDGALNSLQGAVLGGGLIWATGAAAELLVRKEAMGMGDVKLLAGVGALLGWKAGATVFFMAPCLGCVIGIPLILRERLFPPKAAEGKPSGITYRYEADEEAPPDDLVVAGRRLPLVLGCAVALVEGAGLLLLPGARESAFAAAPLYFGVTLGAFAVFYDVVRMRLVREGRWIPRRIAREESGATEERLEGHYLPYGPFLAAASAVMLFFGGEVVAWTARHLFGA